MRRIFLIVYCVFISISVFSNSYWIKDLESQRIPDENVVNMFNQWFNINNQSTFKKTRDYTDDLGIRHQNFKQLYNGLPVEGYLIIVHSKNGTVSGVNGYVMEDVVNTSTLRKSSEGELVVVPVNSDEGIVYHTAYKTIDTKRMVEAYTDATTGAVIKEISLVNNYDVSGTAQTLYNGVQNITCDYVESQGLYRLVDNKRKIYTLNASVADTGTVNTSFRIWLENNHTAEYSKIWEKYVSILTSECLFFGSKIQNFSIENNALKITITNIYNNWWKEWMESKPDVYITLKDKNGNQIYRSNTISNASTPLTFYIDKKYLKMPLEIMFLQLHDEDTLGDDISEFIPIVPTASNKNEWNNKDSEGYYTETISLLGANDAHWGMEKVYDYYKLKFSRNSFDNNDGWIVQYIYPRESEYLNLMGLAMPNNAHAESTYEPYIMLFGLGDGKNSHPFVNYDILAHEFTHLVTANNGQGGLEYNGESGALNESFSDIMACAAEKYALGSNANNWTIGEGIYIKSPDLYLRSLKNPSIGDHPQPDTYKGEYWADTSDLSPTGDQGGVHTNSGVQNKWFYLLSEGGSGSNDNGDSYNVKGIGIDMAAQIAYRNLVTYLTPTATFYDSREGSIAAAKDLYGVSSQAYKSVMDAWYAVGVGEDYNNTITTTDSNLQDEQNPTTIKYMTNGKILVKKGDEIYDMLGKKVK